jgi:hypothetical protein
MMGRGNRWVIVCPLPISRSLLPCCVMFLYYLAPSGRPDCHSLISEDLLRLVQSILLLLDCGTGIPEQPCVYQSGAQGWFHHSSWQFRNLFIGRFDFGTQYPLSTAPNSILIRGPAPGHRYAFPFVFMAQMA